MLLKLQKILNKINLLDQRFFWFGPLIILLLSGTLFTIWQSTGALACPDAFYHAKMAELIKDFGVIKQFPWQQFTIFKESYIDHHFLFHVLLIPFLYLWQPLVAIKVAGVIFSIIFFLLFYIFLKKENIAGPLWYTLLIMTSSPFLERLNLVKAPAYSLIALFLGIFFIFRKKYLFLAITAFIYVWLYDGWPLLLLCTLLYLPFNYPNYKAMAKMLGSVLLGLAAGIIINPYFPTNLSFYRYHIINIGIFNLKDQFQIGQEWYPYVLPDLVMENNFISLFFLLALCSLAILLVRKQISGQKKLFYLLTLSLVFLVLTLRSRRFIEYFIPCAVLFSAYCLTLFFKFHGSWFWPKIFTSKVSRWRFILLIYLLFALWFGVGKVWSAIYQKLSPGNAFPLSTYQSASYWLKQHTPKGSLVFNADWDYWPFLFYQNTYNNYIVGLDPTFMYEYDPALFQIWQNLTQGNIKTHLGKIIKEKFGAEYIVVANVPRNDLFRARLLRSPECTLMFKDSESYIFKIN